MKYILSIAIVLLSMSFLTTTKSSQPSSSVNEDYMNFTEEIISYLGCEYEIIKNAKDVSVVMEKYEDLLIRGRTEGFTPIIVVPNDMIFEIIEFASSDYENNGHINAIIESSKSIDAIEFLNDRVKEAMPEEGYSGYDIMGEFIKQKPVTGFSSLIDYSTGRLYETILVVKIPTDKPWELAAWIPQGGWNECPAPEEQVAVFKYWYEKYGAVPAVVNGDIWELYIEKPPSTKDAAGALALEQFGFCGDIVWQGVESINALAGTLVNSKVWYFWWD